MLYVPNANKTLIQTKVNKIDVKMKHFFDNKYAFPMEDGLLKWHSWQPMAIVFVKKKTTLDQGFSTSLEPFTE